MKDWYVVYESEDDGHNVMTISFEFAKTKEDALKEALYSLNVFAPFPGKIILITQDENEIPDDLEVINLNDITTDDIKTDFKEIRKNKLNS